MIDPETIYSAEWVEWFMLTPQQRWAEYLKLWDTYLMLGDSLDPEPDPQSPFFDADEWSAKPADGRPGVHLVRRSGV
jgi:hypothetical protein